LSSTFKEQSYFVKQSYRNRCHILAANGVQAITIPVDKSKKKQYYKDVRINYAENWLSKNNTAFKSAYANSPFFEDYYPYFQHVLNKKLVFLYDLNIELLELCFKVLQIEKIIKPTSSFQLTYTNCTDFREISSKKKNKPTDWLQNDNKSYQQVFGKEFVNNLSIVDLLFCEGPMSINYLG